ncbi:hypothetical protein [Phaffia rhodozyma]|uniref:Uncharacterized protein n=1 Tax=Phaffia rhodozyma TaxID=264483 RepID=A0A0F7SLY8_PHARH|nr:hypothetical protein [Phaffia rhodozyma]
MEVVDVEKAKIKKHWHITPLGHLIHPVVLKPSHPIPRPTLPRPSSDLPSDQLPTSSTTPLKRKSSSGRKSADPPKRARTVVIDPRRYNRTHLGEHMLGDPELDECFDKRSQWVCEEIEGEDGVVRWINIGHDQNQDHEEKVVVGRQERLRLVLSMILDESGPDGREPSRWDSITPSQSIKPAQVYEDLSNGEGQGGDDDEDEEEDDWIPLGEDADIHEQKGSLLRDSFSPEPTMESLMSDNSQPSDDEDIVDDADGKPSNLTHPTISTSKPVVVSPPTSAPASKSTPDTNSGSNPKQPVGLPLMIDKADPLYHQIAQEKKQGLNVLSSLGFSFNDEDEDIDIKQKGQESTSGGGTLSFESDGEEDTGLVPKKVILPWDDDDDDEDDTEEEQSNIIVPPVNKQFKHNANPVSNQDTIPLPTLPRGKESDKIEKNVSFVGSSSSEDDIREEEEEEGEEEELDPIELAMRELRGWDDLEEPGEQVVQGEGVMRLRGGAGDDVDMEDEEERKVKVKVNQLKGLFAPSAEETTSFSLGLDLDIDAEAEDPTLTASLPTPAPLAPSLSTSHHRLATFVNNQTSSHAPSTASFRPDTEVPYFFPFLHLEQTERAKGPKVQAKSVLEVESGKPRPVPGFWRVDTEEQAQQRWETEHLELTREYKRRHREARKRRNRRGGAEDDGEEEEEKD